MIVSALVSVLLAGLPGEAEGEAGYADFFARAEAASAANEDAAAIALYREAEYYKGTPDSAKRLAKAYEKLGDTAFATLYYRLALARAPEAADAPQLAHSVGTYLGKAGSEGKGMVEIFAPRATKLTVQGKQFPAAPLAFFTAPGDYAVEGVFPSGKKTAQIHVKAGQVATLTFEPIQPPLLTAEQALSEAAIAKGLTADEPPPANVLRILSIVAMAVGVAAVGGGIGVGLSSGADAKQAQNLMLSKAERQAFADSANSKAVPANLLMIVGGAAIVGGGVMFYFSLPEPGMKK